MSGRNGSRIRPEQCLSLPFLKCRVAPRKHRPGHQKWRPDGSVSEPSGRATLCDDSNPRFSAFPSVPEVSTAALALLPELVRSRESYGFSSRPAFARRHIRNAYSHFHSPTIDTSGTAVDTSGTVARSFRNARIDPSGTLYRHIRDGTCALARADWGFWNPKFALTLLTDLDNSLI